ncbi:MAG: BatD family protein [Proteobacteria bacterium]|nr:BatD family protein [Pseudomonadota bacterium]
MNFKLLITLLLLIFNHSVMAKVTVNVDRDPVIADESFQLIFESDKKINTEPDFSPLNNQFTILNNSRRSNIQIYNGKVNHSQQWILSLIANKTGILSIPPIRFGKDVTKPHSIKVLASTPTKQGRNTGDIFIEVEVNTKTPYVQAQLIYTVKLYRATVTNNASLSEPEISGEQAVINKLGEDRSYEIRRNGKRYVVIQRQYVIFPQSSGSLKIEPLIFQGQTGAGRFFNLDPFGPQPKSIVKRSATIELEVKPIPDSFAGDTWLPASQLSIQEQWSVDPGKLQQGEATTRTLTIKAIGLAASHIPSIDSKLPDKLKQYPDQPEFEETNNEYGFIGVRKDKMAIIPTEGGDYTLPAIKIPWWNTVTDKMEIAELPERSIHVDHIVVTPVYNSFNEQVIKNDIASDESEETIKVVGFSSKESSWKWASATLLFLWLATLIIFWKREHNKFVPEDRTETNLSTRYYLKQIKQACKKNDPVMTKQALLDWANIMWPDNKVSSINAIKDYCDEKFEIKLDELNNCLYGKKTEPWDGADFLKSFELQSFENIKPSTATGKLEPLYR